MPLPDDVRQLKHQALEELASAHDYYADTKKAWRVVQRVVDSGRSLTVRNALTGHVTTGTELAAKARDYVARQLSEATFQQFVTIFENYFFDLLRLWLQAYPQSLKEKTVKLEVLLDAPDKAAIGEHVLVQVIDRQLNEVAYKKVREWFDYLNWLVKPGCPMDTEIDRSAEVKASRDIIVHNRGVANKIYEQKAGALARVTAGQRIDVPEPYHRDTWQLLQKVIADVSDAVAAKVP